MISGDTASDNVVLCWGGTNSTDGTDGNYFRMTSGKQYKLVFSTKANLNNYYNSSTGYSKIGTAWIGNGVDCSNGTVPTTSTSADGYTVRINNWGISSSSYGQWYTDSNTNYCNLFNNQSINSNNMPESWHGEMIFEDYQTYFNLARNGLTAKHSIDFMGNNTASSPYKGVGGSSTGTCETTASTPGGYISGVSDVYGLYFRNYKPASWNTASNNGLLYWLYESNDFDNKP